MELQIDRRVIELIAKMQPAAGDFRFVATIMRITPELERSPTSRRTSASASSSGAETSHQTARAPAVERADDGAPRLDSFVRGDTLLLGHSTGRRGRLAHRRLVPRAADIYAQEPVQHLPAICLTFTGKYFERTADGATNICEMVVYLVEATMIKHSSAGPT
jgi:phosphate transport system protein